jgi:hypothetical protein
MFAQAIASTSSPIAMRTPSVGRTMIGAPFGVRQNGTTLTRSVMSVSARSRDSVAHSASVCAAAFARVVAGRRYPDG